MSARVELEHDPRAVPWSDIASRLRPYIARRVPPPDVDDVIQDVLLRMHRGLGGLRDGQRLVSWMFQIARTSIVERARSRARQPLAAAPIEVEPVLEEPSADRTAATPLVECLSVFVARLPSRYREAITLVELDGRCVREAAEIAGLSVSGMKSRVQRGRAQLREMLEVCCEIAVDARGGVLEVTPRRPRCCPRPT